MNMLGFQRFAFSAAALLIIAVPAACSDAAEKRLPEEALFEQMRYGDVDAARDGFEMLVGERVASFYAVPATHAGAASARIIRTNQLVRTLNLWQAAEVEQSLKSGGTSDDASAKILVATDALIEVAAAMMQAQSDPAAANDLPKRQQRDADEIGDKLGRSILRSAIMLRNANLESERARLLQEARKYIAAPMTLRELDVQQGDIAQTFRLSSTTGVTAAGNTQSSQQSSTTNSGITTVGQVVNPAQVEAVTALLEFYYRALFAGDVADLRGRFAEDYWPEETLSTVADGLTGCVLDELGEIRIKQVADDQFHVDIPELVCSGAGGSGDRTMADQLLLIRENGDFRILSLDAQAP